MKILADQNIPLVHEFFSEYGDITCMPGRDITAAHCREMDVLLVRSITVVDEALLSGSRVQFVGSCTIGTDHLDIDYLEANHILWSNAPGCNANAVVQYVLSAMAETTEDWQQKNIGIIGYGNIGGRLHKRLTQLGVKNYYYDPFLVAKDHPNGVDFNTILQADIITCHTPITKTGPYPTYHLLGSEQLSRLSDDALLINSGRGAVIDNQALLREINRRPSLKVALDVWESEPEINQNLLEKVTLATPHIAGYSLEGKEQGTFMVYQAFQKALSSFSSRTIESTSTPTLYKEKSHLLSNNKTNLNVSKEWTSLSTQAQLNALLLACYNIKDDDKRLRTFSSGLEEGGSIAQHFDHLRKTYPVRREYSHYRLPDWIEDKSIQSAFAAISDNSSME
ncbi:MAG: 4-phosphoerythronate dehydrogenase [Cellvibrionaceae bacterium]